MSCSCLTEFEKKIGKVLNLAAGELESRSKFRSLCGKYTSLWEKYEGTGEFAQYAGV